MTHCKTKCMRDAYATYARSNACNLSDCYKSASYAKKRAYDYCLSLVRDYKGVEFGIVSYNCTVFTFGFVGEIDGKTAFFYITPTYDRYIYMDELGV